jgi:glycerol-1-phosphate dehydrogenase [NAD(P)+]
MQALIDKYCNFYRMDAQGREYRTITQRIVVDVGAHERAAEHLQPFLGTGPVAVVMDLNTARVAGDAVVQSLTSAGLAVHRHLLVPEPDDGVVPCDDATIAHVQSLLAAQPCTHAIAVGAGTINDLVKMAAHRLSLSYSCVATAPSMNGYTSAIAAILAAGVKTTQPCTPAIAVLACPKVMAEAPYRMIASGIGDLYSKPVSNADWRLSHRLLGTMHSEIVMEIVDAGSTLLEGVAPHLPERNLDAVARLTGALMLSGLAMQAAGSSQTASGGEHLVSHYIDMTSVSESLPHDFHGVQVACGTIATSALYEYVRGLDPTTLDPAALAASFPTWDVWEEVLRERFRTLSDSVIPHARQGYPTPEALQTRLQKLIDNWEDIFTDAGATLRPTAELKAELDSAHCPTEFPEMPVERERAYAAFAWSKDIRARYTILHLAAELGVLESFARRFVDDQYNRAGLP